MDMDAGQESPTGLIWAALASIGAGISHAAAAGVHGEHRQAAIAFAALALFQVGWGALALVRSWPWIAWLGVAGNSLALAGWLVAKTSGISFIDGLETAEGPGFADTIVAVLALIAVAGALTAAVAPELLRMPSISSVPVAAVTAAVVMAATVATGAHHHDGEGHEHETATIGDHDDDHEHTSGDDHDSDDEHGDTGTTDPDHDHTGTTSPDHDHGGNDNRRNSGGHDDDHDHPPSTDPGRPPHNHDPGTPPHNHDPGTPPHNHDPGTPPPSPRPYNATLPVDLSGFPGVSAEQQARAEALVTSTLVQLPQHYATTDAAYAAGYRSIGDGFTGWEHYINWSMTDDGHELDANYPESLVYQVLPGGEKRLAAAMYLLEPPRTLDQVPDLGGPMTQFHEHNDLCWAPQGDAWRVILVGAPPTPCPSGAVRKEVVPMIHVWVIPSECGPFAALEGASGGQVRPGEEVLCDHVHGSH
jgi:hypothetical protein